MSTCLNGCNSLDKKRYFAIASATFIFTKNGIKRGIAYTLASKEKDRGVTEQDKKVTLTGRIIYRVDFEMCNRDRRKIHKRVSFVRERFRGRTQGIVEKFALCIKSFTID